MTGSPRTDTTPYSFDASRRARIWNFLWLNLLGVAAMLGLFFAVLYGDFMTGAFAASWSWLSDHQVIMALTAATPFFAALLVGRASAARARRKRLAAAHQQAGEAQQAARQARTERRANGRPTP